MAFEFPQLGDDFGGLGADFGAPELGLGEMPFGEGMNPSMPAMGMGDMFSLLDGVPAGLEGSGEDFAAEGIDGSAIQLAGADLDRFKHRFQMALSTAKGAMSSIHEEAKRDREVYKTLPRTPAYPGGPDITMPLSSNKVDGVIAHFRDAIEQRPLASFSVDSGTGPSAAEATATAPVCEAFLEREINRSGSRERLVGALTDEAVIVGTGIAPLSVAQYDKESFVQIGAIIRIEDFFVDRISVENLKDVTCFYRFKERYYNLVEWGERGLVDATAVEKMRGHSTSEPLSLEERDYGFQEGVTLDEETAIHTLFRGYMRYRAEGEARTRLWEVVYSESKQEFLSIRENPARRAFDAPPIIMQRVGKQSGQLFGRGVVRRLDPQQRIADNAINTHLALNNLAASPPVTYRENSPFGQALRASGQGGLYPGMMIPTSGDPNRNDLAVLDQFRNPGLAFQDVQFSNQLADQATFTEEAIGSSSDPRKTLGQFQVEVQRGTMRVRVDLAHYAYDAAMSLRMYWAMMMAYKLAPAGVVEVERDGKLLAFTEVDSDALVQQTSDAMLPLVQSGELSLMDSIQVGDMIQNTRLTDGRIPFARRDDLTISLTGTKVIADKVAELQMLMSLTPMITSLLPMAMQDQYVWYHLRSVITSMGFKDVDKRMPPDPGVVLDDPMMRQQAAAPFMQYLEKSTVM